MGQEISEARFEKGDHETYLSRLRAETTFLETIFKNRSFSNADPVGGYELEAWIVDKDLNPAPINDQYIKQLSDPMVSPELANFNVEFNFQPRRLHDKVFTQFHQELETLWHKAKTTAQSMDTDLVMIGVLPTVRDSDLTIANISLLNRYHALNEQVLRLRNNRPFELDIQGKDILRMLHPDVMLESATTSFQIHFQVPLDLAVRVYNASIIASAPMVAISANSPFMFSKDLWSETRIRLFEQSVEVGGYEHGSHGPMRRVTFGSGYARESLYECFFENLDHYPVLLPTLFDDDVKELSHLRLHNGTLWRWNRPLIGVENGKYSLRIEHHVVPAGPSIIDTVANAAFYYGLTYELSFMEQAPEQQMGFDRARDNFYNAARLGLDSQIIWLDNNKQPMQSLLLKTLIPLASQNLSHLNVNSNEIDLYLGVIQQRTENACNGTAWQRAFTAKYGMDMHALLAAYLEHQNSGLPVHEWTI